MRRILKQEAYLPWDGNPTPPRAVPQRIGPPPQKLAALASATEQEGRGQQDQEDAGNG